MSIKKNNLISNVISNINIKYNTNNDIYYISVNENNLEKWYKYEIICSYNFENNEILWAKDMIIIPKKLKSNINSKKIKNINELQEYILDNSKYIKIISDNRNNYKIYLGLTKIIKT
jgi:hypothetical protein